MAKRYHIVGAGGFGRELLSWVRATPPYAHLSFAGFLDDNAGATAAFGDRYPVVGDIAGHRVDADAAYFMAMGAPAARLRAARLLLARGACFPVLRHPAAIVGEDCSFGQGCVLCPGAVATAGVRAGEFVLVNLGATIGHDARLGDGCTLSSHADVTGGVELGEGVFLGSHASVLPGAKVGDYAVIGAGSVVLRMVKAGVTVMGVPAKPISGED